ncbi:MAG TPA: DUF3187 family protein [Gammaproteobacteria bacterium]|nr:DUF3187 family protein [Gammaproteobacteria bacterium]
MSPAASPERPARRRIGLPAAMIGLALTLAHAPARADVLLEPMRARNLSPPIAIFGVPSWDTDLDPGTRARLTVTGDAANHFRFSDTASEALILDGETWRVNVAYARRLTERWVLAAGLPLVRQSPGALDDFIDLWHAAFNLPDGRRNMRPEDELQFFYDRDAGPGYFRSQADTGLGDLQLSLARGLGRDGAWRLKVTLKLPTGDTDLLAGSGAADLGVSISRGGALRRGPQLAGWFWGAGVLVLGEPDVFPAESRDWVALGMLGLSWQPFASVGFKAQLDLHTAFYDSELEELGDAAVQGTIGGWWALDERRRLTVAVVEDLVVHAAPDVTLHVGFDWSF